RVSAPISRFSLPRKNRRPGGGSGEVRATGNPVGTASGKTLPRPEPGALRRDGRPPRGAGGTEGPDPAEKDGAGRGGQGAGAPRLSRRHRRGKDDDGIHQYLRPLYGGRSDPVSPSGGSDGGDGLL